MRYHIIGDIHGHSDKLKSLLSKLGYTTIDGVWQHPDCIAVFVGDYVDRGPGQLETIRIVRAMIDAGKALGVMGNHELNARAWYQEDPLVPGGHLRKRNAKNRHQHAAFLAETEHDVELHKEMADWFLTLPLWLDLPGFRVVHACWNTPLMAYLEPLLNPDRTMSPAMVEASSRKDSLEYIAVEAITKGMEVNLPEGAFFHDKEQIRRTTTRITWWDPTATTHKAAAVVSHSERATIPDTEMPTEKLIGYDNAKPLFIGHYWCSGTPTLLTSHIACVDYSAGKGGPLVAYEWDGETVLSNDKFVMTDD